MTAKRGTQWKTSWRRQKPSVGTAPQDMWWFLNFGDGPPGESLYEQPLPGIGIVPPFWAGGIFGTVAPLVSSFTAFSASVQRGPIQSWFVQTDWFIGQQLFQARVAALPLPAIFTNLNILGASPFPVLVRAVAVMLVVEPEGLGFKQSLWVDGTLRQETISAAPYVGAGMTRVRPRAGLLNSFAGGNALPSPQEIQDWFTDTRYGSPFPVAAQIPGKTLDQYDAANTPGVVPNPLVNLAGGQNAPLIPLGAPPIPANLFLPTTFGY